MGSAKKPFHSIRSEHGELMESIVDNPHFIVGMPGGRLGEVHYKIGIMVFNPVEETGKGFHSRL
jgi:hypothetical protein